jgi:hypothetical protein
MTSPGDANGNDVRIHLAPHPKKLHRDASMILAHVAHPRAVETPIKIDHTRHDVMVAPEPPDVLAGTHRTSLLEQPCVREHSPAEPLVVWISIDVVRQRQSCLPHEPRGDEPIDEPVTRRSHGVTR